VTQAPNPNTISEATRRDIFDVLRLESVSWSGRLGEVEFLSKLYDLDQLPSTDYRFRSMAGDVRQHRVNNPTDWEDDWVYRDERLDLLHCPDSEFLRFLCEILHPVVRPETDEVEELTRAFNSSLQTDGWEVSEVSRMAGRPIFEARRLVPGRPVARSAAPITKILSADYIAQQMDRMEAAIEADPELAIGTAKEFVETICKTILSEVGNPAPAKADLPALVKLVRVQLELLPDNVHEKAKGADTIKAILASLGTTAQGLAELRGLYGTGHGKAASTTGLQPRHARLAVGAATTLGVFFYETWQYRKARGQK
jgi:hypothetical protein